MSSHTARWIKVLAILVLAVPVFVTPTASNGYAQNDSHTFTETGKTVRGKFLAYWNEHGGLAQQGFPISEELSEVSSTDGKTYVVQYFERAQFQLHPEFAGTANEVLLTLLGVQFYQQKYPNGAPSQTPNTEADSVLMVETGKKLGGLFRNYWSAHGGLAQMGLPISDEFVEVSALNGKQYKVQYFERAVFEHHPEFAGTANEVLLSQLGTFAWQAKQAPPAAPTATPTRTPSPTSTVPLTCDTAGNKNGEATPSIGRPGDTMQFTARGFSPNEAVYFWFEVPTGVFLDGPTQVPPQLIDADGTVGPLPLNPATLLSMAEGRWAVTFEGMESHHQAIIFFCVYK